MKRIFIILSCLIGFSTFAQNDAAVVASLKSGDAIKFSSYFDNNIDIKLPKQNEMQNVNKAEASVTIKKFFDGNNINSFEIISQREMSGTMYIAGKLKTDRQDYNLTVMLKNKGDNASVITVRIN